MPDINKWTEFQNEFSEWAFETFKGQKIDGKLKHMKKEIDEIIENPDDIIEWADVMLLFLNASKQQGLDMDQILDACKEKFEIIKKREWQEPDEDGTIQHKQQIKEER